MANAVELLYFVQQRCPLYMQSLEEELDITGEPCAGPRPPAPLSSLPGPGRPGHSPSYTRPRFRDRGAARERDEGVMGDSDGNAEN